MRILKQTVTAKLRILVDPAQQQLLQDTMRACRDACNFVSDHVFRTRDLSIKGLNKALYYEIRYRFALRSQMTQSCIRAVVAGYKAILTNQHEWIKPNFRKPQMDLVRGRDYSLSKDQATFSVNTLKGRIRVPFCKRGFERYFAEGCRFGTAKLVYRHGKFFLHVPVSYEVNVPSLSDISHVAGVDRGIRFLAACYDSDGKTAFFSGKRIREKRAHCKALRTQLQQVKTPSSRRRLKAVGSRENRWIRDTDHCISKALAEQHPAGTLFVLEDLRGIRSASEKIRVRDRYLLVSWPYRDLEQKLRYKAERSGQAVIFVDPRYTSQTCPVCGHVHKLNRDKRNHIFRCRSCGYTSNDDRIGAMNLYRMGIGCLEGGTVPDTAVVQHV